MLKAIHAQEGKKVARVKSRVVVEELRSMKLKEDARQAEDGVKETLTYYDFPSEPWTCICIKNVIERLNREIRRRIPCSRQFSKRKFCLHASLCSTALCGWYLIGKQEIYKYEALGVSLGGYLERWLTSFPRGCKPICKKNFDTTYIYFYYDF